MGAGRCLGAHRAHAGRVIRGLVVATGLVAVRHPGLLGASHALPLAGLGLLSDLFQDGLQVLDDLALLLARLLARVRLAEALLDFAHLLDGLAKGAIVVTLTLALPLSLLAIVLRFLLPQ